MKKLRDITALALALCMIVALSACGGGAGPGTGNPVEPGPGTVDPGPDVRPGGDEDEPAPPQGSGEEGPGDPDIPASGSGGIKLGLCADAAAIGAAGLAHSDKYTLITGVMDLGAAFEGGELDAAIVPIDAAARIYASTGGKAKLAAVTASGGWKVVERGTLVHDMYALAGKTVYIPEESAMASKLFEYIALRYDFIIGDTLKLEPVPTADLGNYDLVLMPAILAGSTIVRDADTHFALDLGEELENIAGLTLLPVGCLIVRSDMDGDALSGLLEDLKTSQETLSDNLDYAVELRLAASQEEAWAAANDSCGFVWYTGGEMIEELESFLDLLYELDPALIGGHIPDDGFYI